ncbi:unnamed protein product [Acanthosepion pharaonis]|uniref:Uncharacterized protein n=1 Tax=Acanthosepion pharaonis TaxID=158019 RepID=A0A812DG15_ACAPH|nr:unnamed protein product [Sepia pharaonis]
MVLFPPSLVESYLVAVPADNPLQDILDQFPSLIRPFTYTETVKYHTVHKIHTSGPPVFSKPRRLAPDQYKLAREEFQQMLDLGIIRPSSSPFASPLHMVPKAQEGAWRPCGDYRRLNAQTVPDKYPVPNLADFAISLQGARVFTKIDLRKTFLSNPRRRRRYSQNGNHNSFRPIRVSTNALRFAKRRAILSD